MSRPRGNVLGRKAEEKRKSAVRVEPQTLLNLLKGSSEIFGPIQADQIESISPAVVFRDDIGALRCWMGDTTTIINPATHIERAEQVERSLDEVVRAYVVATPDGACLFPHTEDLVRKAGLATLEELQQEFEGKAKVEVGGVTKADGTVVSLAAILTGMPEFLHEQHKAGVDYPGAQAALVQHLQDLR